MNSLVQKDEEKKILMEFLNKFIKSTQSEVEKGVNPGGHYKAVWTRDAAFILKDQFLSGHFKIILEQILLIWSNQIIATTKEEKSISNFLHSDFKIKPLLYGRGSPEMNFNPIIADDNTKKKFDGALPTTIYYENNFCEVYGQSPDIDSIALMISTTSYILSNLLDLKDNHTKIESVVTFSRNERIDNKKRIENEITSFSKFSLNEILNFLVPRMLKALKYLQSKDIDNDGLLEQKHNEDWMDTTLRIGKVVYSQACWILALKNFSLLLKKFGNPIESKRLEQMANRTILAVEEKMWSAKDGCYVDLLDADLHLDVKMHNRLVTQDISLYLVALTEDNKDSNYNYIDDENMKEYSTRSENYTNNSINSDIHQHALSTLEVLKKRAWKNNLPLVTETGITKTGPWLLETNEYHNHTCWPWITGIEMLARSRFGKLDDCNILLSKFFTNDGVNPNMLYEWVNPLTFQGSGAYPFRTGISSIRITAMETLTMNIEDTSIIK
ncbi:MAG: GH116 family glycosyl hydrolase [Nitrososphaeraceae archaeon]